MKFTKKYSEIFLSKNQTKYNFAMASHLYVHWVPLDVGEFDEIPLVLIENFEENCSIEEIFVYFFDKIELLEIYMKVNPDEKLIEKLIDFIEIYEKKELKSSLFEKINSKKIQF